MLRPLKQANTPKPGEAAKQHLGSTGLPATITTTLQTPPPRPTQALPSAFSNAPYGTPQPFANAAEAVAWCADRSDEPPRLIRYAPPSDGGTNQVPVWAVKSSENLATINSLEGIIFAPQVDAMSLTGACAFGGKAEGVLGEKGQARRSENKVETVWQTTSKIKSEKKFLLHKGEKKMPFGKSKQLRLKDGDAIAIRFTDDLKGGLGADGMIFAAGPRATHYPDRKKAEQGDAGYPTLIKDGRETLTGTFTNICKAAESANFDRLTLTGISAGRFNFPWSVSGEEMGVAAIENAGRFKAIVVCPWRDPKAGNAGISAAYDSLMNGQRNDPTYLLGY